MDPFVRDLLIAVLVFFFGEMLINTFVADANAKKTLYYNFSNSMCMYDTLWKVLAFLRHDILEYRKEDT